MAEHENERVVRTLIADAVNGKRYGTVSEHCHDDVVMHRPGGDEEVGVDAYVAHYRRLHDAFPDFDARVRDVLADEDRVAVRLELTGTHEGELLGITSTGRSVNFTAQIIYRLRDGQIAEEWHESDRLGLLQQLDEQ
jgi:steroid delta-isomerase-like uncharacterized protein